jgi:hypothetical protein
MLTAMLKPMTPLLLMPRSLTAVGCVDALVVSTVIAEEVDARVLLVNNGKEVVEGGCEVDEVGEGVLEEAVDDVLEKADGWSGLSRCM